MAKKSNNNIPSEEDESLAVNPGDFFSRRDAQESEETLSENLEEKNVNPVISSDNVTETSIGNKYHIRSGKVQIDYESQGRFDCPPTLWFEDYDMDDVNDLTLAREDAILETLISILNKSKDTATEKEQNFDVGDMTIEEFYETLIGIKMTFNTKMHKHRWLCECQNEITENKKRFSEMIIDLTTLKYRSIEDCDKDIVSYFKELFDKLDNKRWNDYLIARYGEIKNITKKEELTKLKTVDKLLVPLHDNIYTFCITRIKHVIRGYQIANKEFNPQQNKIRPFGKGGDYTDDQKQQINLLKEEKAKKALLYSQALSLTHINGELIKDESYKIKIFRTMKRQGFINLSNFMGHVQFGIHDERDIQCDLCNKIERGWLQRRFNPIELLPLDDSDRPVTGGKLGDTPGINVLIGI